MRSHPPALRDVAVVGGGIVGLATARALLRRHPLDLVLLEAETRLAGHQTGHNSGVIHSGLYYRPGSARAERCVAGREALYAFCREHGLAHARRGKLVLATSAAEAARLDELERRGVANGLQGIERVAAGRIAELEPHARGCAALWVPETGVVDFGDVAREIARGLAGRGAELRTGARVLAVERRPGALVLRHAGGEVRTRFLIACAGLQADRLARLCGLDPALRIVPFRGEYLELAPERAGLVRGLIYPVPDPELPFLGVHFTRTVHERVEVGPNALLAWSREAYGPWRLSARDALSTLSYPGFWRMVRRHARTGARELHRSLRRSVQLRALQRMLPELRSGDLRRAGSGVRAQAVSRDGRLVDDFRVLEAEGMLHLLNAPSPAATAALALGEALADRALPALAS